MDVDKRILNDYMDACAVAKETEAEIGRLERKRKAVGDKVTGSNPEWPYEPRSFSVGGTAGTAADAARLGFERRVLERQKQEAEVLRGQVEEWMGGIPFRMQRMIRYKVFQNLTWEEVAARMKSKQGGEAVRKEFERFMKKN